MVTFPRFEVLSPRPIDVVEDGFSLCRLGLADEGVVGTAVLKDNYGTVDSPVAVGTPATAEGELIVAAQNTTRLLHNDLRVFVPLTFRRVLAHHHRSGPYPGRTSVAAPFRGP